MSEHHADPCEFPEPSAELVLIRVLVEAHLETSPRKLGERFLMVAAEKLADEEAMSQVFLIRPTSQWAAARTARQQAASLFRRYLPTFLARLAPAPRIRRRPGSSQPRQP